MLVNENWPQEEPTPIYLSSEDDARLQAVCVAADGTAFKELRNTAIAALFLASGVTAAELRQLHVDDLNMHDERPTVFIDKHGPRIARRVPIDAVVMIDVNAATASSRCALPWKLLGIHSSTINMSGRDLQGSCRAQRFSKRLGQSLTATVRTLSPEAHPFSIERKREPGRRPKVFAVYVPFNFEPVREVFARRIVDHVPTDHQKQALVTREKEAAGVR
jgi:hypothetical protein